MIPGAWDSSWDSPTAAAPYIDVPLPTSARSRPSGSNRNRRPNVPLPTNPPNRGVPPPPRPPFPVQQPTYEIPLPTTTGQGDSRRPIVIAVFGQTGTGKTSLIKAVTGVDLEVGHGLTSQTQDVNEVPCMIDNEQVVLIDTPGFSDTNHSDTEILRRIAEWMKDTYDEGFLLSGIIYLHRIMDIRMEGPSLKNLRMMQQLCGSDSLRNVVLATTMWEKVTNEEGLRREAELEQTFWKSMIDGGATTSKIKTQSAAEAQSLVRSMMKNTPRSTRLQEELSSGLTLVQTAAGIEIKEEIAKLEQKLRAEHDAEMQELRAAQANRNAQLESQIRNEMAESRLRLERLEEEKRLLTNLRPTRLPKVKRSGLFRMGSYCCHSCGHKTQRVGKWTCSKCHEKQRNQW